MSTDGPLTNQSHVDDDVLEEIASGSLDAASEQRARAHVAACAACRQRYHALIALRRALAGAPSSSLSTATRVEDEGVLRRVLAISHPDGTQSTRPAPPPRRRIHAAVPIAAAAAAACVALFVVLGPPSAPDGPVPAAPVLAATVLHAKGATLDGQPVAQGAAWMAGAALDVDAGGLVEVSLVRGGTLRVFPESQLTLAARGEHVELAHGKVWAIVEAGHGPFEITTEQGSARVLGTSFLVETRPAATDVKVVEGRVEVRGTGRHVEPVVVNGGERTHLARGARAEAPRRYDAREDGDQWQRFFDGLFKAIQQGIDDVIKAFDPKHKR